MIKLNKLKLASLALAGLSAVASGNAVAASMTVDSNGGLEVFELGSNKDYWFKIGGRLHVDGAWYDGNAAERSLFPSSTRIRRAKVGLKGGVGNQWVYKLDIDHQDTALNNQTTTAKFKLGEAFIAYNGCKNIWFALGQISVPFSLEGWGSSDESPFMEVSLPASAFAPDLGIGLYAEWHNDMFTLAGAVYNPRAGTIQTGDVLSNAPATVVGAGPNGSFPGSAPVGAGGRITFSPVHNAETVYHAGVSYRYQGMQEFANNFNFSTAPEIAARQAPQLFTNIPPNSTRNYSVTGLELAARYNQFMAAVEYMSANADRVSTTYDGADPRNPGGDLDFDGYSAMVSWVITGETKDYDFVSGTFGRVHPKSSKGAWELLARQSYVRLLDNQDLAQLPIPWIVPNAYAVGTANNAGSPGILNGNMPANSPNDMVGNAHSTTIGLTWWVNDNVRFLANYARMSYPTARTASSLGSLLNVNQPNSNGGINVNAFGLRGQVNW